MQFPPSCIPYCNVRSLILCLTFICSLYLSELAELPGDVEDLDEGEGHGDEAEHQVRDGQVHDEDVARRPHERVPRNHVDHHLEAWVGHRSVLLWNFI